MITDLPKAGCSFAWQGECWLWRGTDAVLVIMLRCRFWIPSPQQNGCSGHLSRSRCQDRRQLILLGSNINCERDICSTESCHDDNHWAIWVVFHYHSEAPCGDCCWGFLRSVLVMLASALKEGIVRNQREISWDLCPHTTDASQQLEKKLDMDMSRTSTSSRPEGTLCSDIIVASF